MANSNGTITVEELKKLLEEWNLVIGFLFLTWICLLQFAYANRNRFLYIIKLIFLWLLWPVTLTCFVLAAVYRINWITGGIAIAMACLVGLMWLSYFIASFRLFARTRSMWSFNPETNILLNVPLHDAWHGQPGTWAPAGCGTAWAPPGTGGCRTGRGPDCQPWCAGSTWDSCRRPGLACGW